MYVHLFSSKGCKYLSDYEQSRYFLARHIIIISTARLRELIVFEQNFDFGYFGFLMVLHGIPRVEFRKISVRTCLTY